MKLILNRDVKNTVEKEPEFPKIIYILLSISLVLFVILVALAIHLRFADAEDDHDHRLIIPGEHHITKKILDSQENSDKRHLRKNLPEVILMGANGTGLGLLKEVLEDHPQLKILQKKLGFFEDATIFNKGLYWYQ